MHIGADADDLASLLGQLGFGGSEHDPAVRTVAGELVERVSAEMTR